MLYPLSYGRTTGWRSVYYSPFFLAACRIRGQDKRTRLRTLAGKSPGPAADKTRVGTMRPYE